MLSVIYAECHYLKCHKKALYAGCRCVECRGAIIRANTFIVRKELSQVSSLLLRIICYVLSQRPVLKKCLDRKLQITVEIKKLLIRHSFVSITVVPVENTRN
jgi:hypothetical protein